MGVLFNSASGQDPRYYEKKAKVERERERRLDD